MKAEYSNEAAGPCVGILALTRFGLSQLQMSQKSAVFSLEPNVIYFLKEW